MKKEWIRIMQSIWFALGVCFTFALCFFSEIVTGEKSSTILQVLNNMSRSVMAQEPQLYPAVAIRNAFSGYVTLFVPIISALPMIHNLHIETQSGWKRFYISRKSRQEYYWHKWVAGMLSGGCMLLVVAVLFQSFMALSVPKMDAELLEEVGIHQNNLLLDLIKVYIGIFCYGAFSVVPAILISSFSNNFYFMICIPFMLSYFGDVSISALGGFLRKHNIWEKFSTITDLLFSRSYLGIVESRWDLLVEGMRIVLMVILLLLTYFLLVSKRIDCGE